MALTISVIVCAYNEASYLAPCLDSLRQQFRVPDEILVINNASTDATREVAGAVPGVPGAEITQNKLTGRKNAHIIALDIKEYISADQKADEILRAIRRQGALSIACHPHHRAVRRLEIEAPLLVEDAAPGAEGLAVRPRGALRERQHRADAVPQGELGWHQRSKAGRSRHGKAAPPTSGDCLMEVRLRPVAVDPACSDERMSRRPRPFGSMSTGRGRRRGRELTGVTRATRSGAADVVIRTDGRR